LATHHLTGILDKLDAEQRNCFAAIRLFLNFAVQRRYIPHSPLAGLKAPKAGECGRVLTLDELKIVWAATLKLGMFGNICQLLITTGQRENQIRSLRADWIHDGSIFFPAEVMKNNRPHRTPCGPLTASILATLPDEGLLFPARGKDTPFNGF